MAQSQIQEQKQEQRLLQTVSQQQLLQSHLIELPIERSEALDAALENIGRDDEDLPVYHGGQSSAEEREEMVYGQSLSFYDELLEQVGEMELSDQERYVLEYLIRVIYIYCLVLHILKMKLEKKQLKE